MNPSRFYLVRALWYAALAIAAGCFAAAVCRDVAPEHLNWIALAAIFAGIGECVTATIMVFRNLAYFCRGRVPGSMVRSDVIKGYILAIGGLCVVGTLLPVVKVGLYLDDAIVICGSIALIGEGLQLLVRHFTERCQERTA